MHDVIDEVDVSGAVNCSKEMVCAWLARGRISLEGAMNVRVAQGTLSEIASKPDALQHWQCAAAVMRYAIPEANPSLYFGLSLGITFPLNILFGIPLYAYVARAVLA